MSYKYEHFIPENTALKNAEKIGVYDANNKRLFGIPLGTLAPRTDTPLYSFGLLSDLHIVERDLADIISTRSSLKFDNALSFFEVQGCAFCCHCGDMTNIGFYMEGDSVNLYPHQFTEYKRICDLHPDLPVYGVCGNHDSYVNPVTDTLTKLQQHTGHGLYYSVNYNNDVFFFIGQPKATEPMNVEQLQWLYEQLEANRNKRCFVFVHPFLSDDSGNALSVYGNKIFDWWEHTPVFKNLMSHYKNTILFHGHSHLTFSHQVVEKSANYTDKNGFKSVHVPSCANPMEIVNGERVNSTHQSLGYIVDVYDDSVVLKAVDFGEVKNNTMIDPKWIPIATYRLDTTIQTIEADSFDDDTNLLF